MPVPRLSARARLLVTAVLAIAAYAYVQDRVTAAGARRYAALQREAVAGRGTLVTVDQIMQPAISQSVRAGLMAAAGVGILGLLWARFAASRESRPSSRD